MNINTSHITPITDHKGRRLEKLRVSLTNDCNFRCTYCVGDLFKDKDHPMGKADRFVMPPKQQEGKKLTAQEFMHIIADIHRLSPLKQIRFTGGEPLLHKDLFALIEGVKSLGIKEVGLTTNAFYLDKRLEDLKSAELTSINVSLDAMDSDTLRRMSGVPNADKVIANIKLAVENGLPVKLNSVIMNGLNSNQILPLLDFAQSQNIIIRYIEFMKMGSYYQQHDSFIYSEADILERIRTKYNITKNIRKATSTANYWAIDGGAEFGIIANDSSPFCHDCNRLRLDSYGKIYGCLSNPSGFKVTTDGSCLISTQQVLSKALAQKQNNHFEGSEIVMQHIGG